MSMEFVGIIDAIEHTRAHVAKWMRTTPLMRAGRLAGLRAEVVPSPLGVVGIIGPWNFPLHLVIMPAAAAFAAGSRVMIKMSEITLRHRTCSPPSLRSISTRRNWRS